MHFVVVFAVTTAAAGLCGGKVLLGPNARTVPIRGLFSHAGWEAEGRA